MEAISFNDIPQAMVYLTSKVESIEQYLQRNDKLFNRPLDKWFDIDELREYHPDKPSKPTVYSWIANRKIPHHKGGKKLRFKQSEIDAWLQSENKTIHYEQ